MPRTLLPAIVAVVFAAPLAADDTASWVGQRVMMKRPGAKLSRLAADGTPVEFPARYAALTVIAEGDGWVRLRAGGHEGRADPAEWVRVADAPAHFTALIRSDPTSSWGWHQRGVARDEAADYAAAVADYTEALRLEPTCTASLNNRGVAWRARKEYAKAAADFTAAVALDPDDVFAVRNRADVLARTGKYEAAAADFATAVRLDPGDPAALNGRAWLLATCPLDRVRDGKAAVEAAAAACERTDWATAAYVDTLAAAYAEVGDFGRAVGYQSQALRDEAFVAAHGPAARERLALYERKTPWREK